jgi:predicted DCC family thiol-disulfide oxidoreductase YuxK
MIQAVSRMRAGWDRYFFSSAGPVDLCVGRLVFFSLAFLYYVSQDFSEWGTVGAEFWMPTAFFSALHLRALSPEAITAVQSVWKISLALAAVGLWTRSAMLLSFAGSFYLLGLPHNFGQTQHFDTLVVIVCGVLATSRAGDAWSLDALRRAARLGNPARDSDLPSADYRWPVRAIWVTTALVFFAAGVSKLRHSGLTWIFSDHLAILLVRHQYYVSDGEPLTAWGPIIASYAWAARALAAVAVLTEVLYPLALFSTRARIVLVPAGIGFLVGIRLLMGPTFEPFVLCNMFWVPWEWLGHRLSAYLGTGSRYTLVYDGACGMCRGTAGVLARTDLLGRLELVDVTGTRDLPSRFAGLTLEECLDQMWLIAPDGKRYGGFEAYRRLSRLLPVLWPIAPVLRLPAARPLGSRAYAFIAARRGHAARSLRTQPEQR